MKVSALMTVFCYFLLSASAQPVDKAKLDSIFDNLEKHNLAIGSVAIAEGGKLVYQRSFGKDQAATSEYRIGSISKVFTAIMVYQLIDAHRLSLDDKLSKFFPELPNASQITIRELLGHRSGLPAYTDNKLTGYDTWKDQPQSHEKLLAMIKSQQPAFPAGQKPDYNNSNYLLLGFILEKIYQKPYKDIVIERIIRKIELRYTYYGSKAGFQPGEAISYKYFNNEWKQDKAVFLENFGGAGAMISTPADMVLLINALFAGKLISRRSLDTMKTITDGYGKGLFPYGDNNHAGFGHNGKTEGFGSSLQYYPESKLAIAYCTNGEIYPKAEILNDIFAVCFHQPVTISCFQPVSVPAQILNNYSGVYSDPKTGMQVTNTIDSNRLVLVTKGQPFELLSLSDRRFWNVPFGFFFEFSADGNKLWIKDVDDIYELQKTGRH